MELPSLFTASIAYAASTPGTPVAWAGTVLAPADAPIAPAQQAAEPAPVVASTPPVRPTIQVTTEGRLTGIDAVLDQIFGSLARQVGPLVTNEILPVIQQDKELQRTVGAAVGKAVWEQAKPWVILLTAAMGTIAVVQVYKATRKRRPR